MWTKRTLMFLIALAACGEQQDLALDHPRQMVAIDQDEAARQDDSSTMMVREGVRPNNTNCTWPLCGVVHNRSGHGLKLSQESNDHWSCVAIGPYGDLPDGADSNTHFSWPDTDCFASRDCSIFYRGRLYAPGEWIRIYNDVWIFNINC